MFSTISPTTKPPSYDLNTIFRPYNAAECQEQGGNKNAGEHHKPSAAAREEIKTLFSIEISRLPRLVADEPLSSWLLRAANLVPDIVMRDALEVSRKGGLAANEILILGGRVAQSDLRALERAEAMINGGLLYRDFAAIALAYACANFIEFEDALWDLGLHPTDPFGDFKLFELLDDCGIMPHEDLLAVRKECLARGVTLGYGLVKNGVLSGPFIKVVLEYLAFVASRKLEYHNLVLTIISILRDGDTMYGAEGGGMSPEARLVSQLPIATADRALGNLLLCTDLVELDDLIFCLEVALEDKRSLGAVIHDFMLVDPVILQAARGLAYMVCEKKLTARRSVELLEEVKRTGMPLAQICSAEPTNITVMSSSGNGLNAVSSIA